MIKIIKGTYGTKRLNSKSAPFSLSEAEEKRLVDLGIAEYVSVPGVPAQDKTQLEKKTETKKSNKGKAAKKK